jgi:hypothetical protein
VVALLPQGHTRKDKMIKVEVTKIWLGKVSVRDYVYKKALKTKQSLGITHGKEFMIIPYENLKKAKQYTDTIIQSKFNNKKYRLVDFDWKPYKEDNPNQGKLWQNTKPNLNEIT